MGRVPFQESLGLSCLCLWIRLSQGSPSLRNSVPWWGWGQFPWAASSLGSSSLVTVSCSVGTIVLGKVADDSRELLHASGNPEAGRCLCQGRRSETEVWPKRQSDSIALISSYTILIFQWTSLWGLLMTHSQRWWPLPSFGALPPPSLLWMAERRCQNSIQVPL